MTARLLSALVLIALTARVSAFGQEGEHWSVSGGEMGTSDPSHAQSSFSIPAILNVPRGAMLAMRTDGELAPNVSANGDNFSGTLARPLVVDGVVVAETGAAVTGRVLGIGTAARRGTGTRWRMQITELTLIDGQQVALRSQLVSRAVASAANADPSTITPDDLLTFRLDNPMRIDTTRTNQAFRPIQPGEADGGANQTAGVTNLTPPLPPTTPSTPSTSVVPPANSTTYQYFSTPQYGAGTPYDASVSSYYGAPYSYGWSNPGGLGYYGAGLGYYGALPYGFGFGFSYGRYPYRSYPYGGYYSPYRYYAPYRYGVPYRYGTPYRGYPAPQHVYPPFRPYTGGGGVFRGGGNFSRSGGSFSRGGGYRR